MYCVNCGAKVHDAQTLCAKCLTLVTKKTPSQQRVAAQTKSGNAPQAVSTSSAATFDLAAIIRLRSRRRLFAAFGFLVLGLLLWAAVPRYVGHLFFPSRVMSPIAFELASLRANPHRTYGNGLSVYEQNKIFLIGSLLIMLGTGLIVFRLIKKDKNHAAYKIVTQLKYGSIEMLSEAFAKAQQAGHLTIGSYRLNSQFLFKIGFFLFKIYPVSQLTWAYKKVIKRNVHGIPAGKGYYLVMHFGKFGKISVIAKEPVVNEGLSYLIRLCPQAVFGTNRLLGSGLLKNAKK